MPERTTNPLGPRLDGVTLYLAFFQNPLANELLLAEPLSESCQERGDIPFGGSGLQTLVALSMM